VSGAALLLALFWLGLAWLGVFGMHTPTKMHESIHFFYTTQPHPTPTPTQPQPNPTPTPNRIDQLLVPNMLSGLKPLAEMDPWHFCERVLGLALPNLYVWLLSFFIVRNWWLVLKV